MWKIPIGRLCLAASRCNDGVLKSLSNASKFMKTYANEKRIIFEIYYHQKNRIKSSDHKCFESKH